MRVTVLGGAAWNRMIHAPLSDAAEVVFVSHDRLAAPADFLASMIDRDKRLAVCTMASAGAIAFDADGRRYDIPAVPDVAIVDTNGAGDAFFAGVLFGMLSGLPLEVTLRYGALAGALAVSSPDLASEDLDAEALRTRAI